MIHVVLDPNCHHGHHVFADSANNGPYGKALIEELIPAIEKRFRAIPRPAARLLTGHSSGGWSSLWLQVTYPDFFGGVWSTAPDPVDFRDFQRIDLYRAGENMFADARGVPRPIARRGTEPVLFYKPFSDMEVVMGHGGQLASFEAVFSERGDDGYPETPVGPQDRRDRSEGREELGEVRHPPRPRAELEDARAEARGARSTSTWATSTRSTSRARRGSSASR